MHSADELNPFAKAANCLSPPPVSSVFAIKNTFGGSPGTLVSGWPSISGMRSDSSLQLSRRFSTRVQNTLESDWFQAIAFFRPACFEKITVPQLENQKNPQQSFAIAA